MSIPILYKLRKLENKLLCLFPAKTRISDRFAEDMLAGSLRAVFQIAFNHQSLHQSLDISIFIAAVNDILGNADLFQILLTGVIVVGIHDD